MSVAITAAVVTVGANVYSAYSADKQVSRNNARADEQDALAKENTAKLEELSREELQVQKDRLADWEGTFGKLEDNLGAYYNNLEADDVRRTGFEQEKQRHQDYVKQIKRSFGASGDTGSNVEQLALASAGLQSSQNIARIDNTAERVVKEEQASFLKIGLNKEAGIRQGISGASRGLQTVLGGTASTARQEATSAKGQADQARGIRDQAIGGLIDTNLADATSFVADHQLIATGSDYI